MYCKLDGFTLPVEAKGGWTLKNGTAPVRRTFRMPIPLANKLLKNAKDGKSRLEIDGRDGRPGAAFGEAYAYFAKLTILGSGPTDSPYETELVVADSRWRWKYQHVFGSFNIPRKTGTIRRIGSAEQQATQKLADTIGFFAWSLNGGRKKWTAFEVMTVVMDQVVGKQNWRYINTGNLVFADIQDLTIDGPADAAIGQMLSDPAFGGALDLYHDKNGDIIIYNRLDGEERPLVGAPRISGAIYEDHINLKKPAIINQPLWSVQDRRLERPKEVHVLFERRIELRIDLITRLAQLGATIDPIKPPLYGTNVMPSPEDFQHQGRTIIAEQWIDLEFYLDFLKTKTPPGLLNLSENVLVKGWASNLLERYPEVDDSGLWGRRVDYIRQHYRLTWQVEKTWRDRIRELKAERLTSEDRTTGTRPNAAVFANYAQFNTWRSNSPRFNSNKQHPQDIVNNRFANRIGGKGNSIAGPIRGTDYTKLSPSPAFVSIIDNEQCIVHFEFGKGSDNSYQVSRYIRSALTRGSIPSDDPTKGNQWLQFAALESPYDASMILAADLGAPADNRRYHRVIINGLQAQTSLPTQRQGVAKGPILEVRVKPAILVARVGWEDKKSKLDDIYSPLGSGQGLPSFINNLPTPINKTNLEKYALGVAAKAYASYLDRVEGGLTTGINTKMTIQGTASEVSFEADPTLGAVTKVVMPAEAPLYDLAAVLPKSVRRVVDRIIDKP